MILEYKLHRFEDGKTGAPPWVECGGFLPNNGDFTLIGFSPSIHEYYIPDSVDSKTVEELKARSLAIHEVTPYRNDDGSFMTEAEVEAMVQSIVDINDIP